MGHRRWVLSGIGLLLMLLAWFTYDPGIFLRAPVTIPDAPPGSVLPRAQEDKAAATRRDFSPGKKVDSGVEADLATGAGREIPGEKLVRFSTREGYEKFLAAAPPGTVLGRLEALRALRVRDGDWLSATAQGNGGTISGNYYVRVPSVPLEVKERGDAIYQAVGKKALELIGADAVRDAWGGGITVGLMDTPLEGTETANSENAGHGTAMRSLISGNSGAARGAAPASTIAGFPVLDMDGKGSSFGLAEALVRAVEQGVRVINMSLGSEGDSPVVRDAVAYALARNVVLVAAAGNDAVNRVSFPAAYEGVVAVGSVDANGQSLYFSNRGPQVDVVAPGYAVVAAWPGQKYVEVSGTSASTALVSGAMAALLSREPGLTGAQAARLLVSYADDVGAPGRDDESGAGVVNLQRVLERNQRGIVDVAVAGVILREEGTLGKITVGVQNRGTETVNSPSLEITAGSERRKFYFGSLAPGQTAAETLTFDLARARLEGGISAGAGAEVRGDQRPENDLWTGYFRISK